MTLPRLIRALPCLLLLLGAAPAPQTPTPDLAALVAEAGIIAVGTVSSAAPDSSSAVISVDEYYKRGLPQFSLQIVPDCPPPAQASCLQVQPHYAPGEQVILFLHPVGAGWSLVDGAAGKYMIRHGQVLNGAGVAADSVDEIKAKLVELTGQPAGTAPTQDPTPEVTPTDSDAAPSPFLYIGVIAVGVLGLAAMAVLAGRARRG